MDDVSYTTGLDLGQAGDYSALAIAERTPADDGARYDIRELRRWPLGTRYPAIVGDVVAVMGREPVAPAGQLALDQTGVGRAVFDCFAEALPGERLVGVTITAGFEAQKAAWNQWHVPKVELIGLLQLVLQSERLRVAPSLPEAAALQRELQLYQMRVTPAAHVQFGQWREGEHDDLVLAVALSLWWSEREANNRWWFA